MTSIRNFEQLILVKQLYEDARELAERRDRLALTKAIILLDLSIEQLLKSILLNHNPSFFIPRGKSDINWKELWQNASDAVRKEKGVALSEQSESSSLHQLRNLVQHHGTEPPTSDVKRYIASTARMMANSFRDAFDLDFHKLRSFDFVENNDLRRLLNESEEFLSNGNPVVCIIGCKLARKLIVDAIHRYTTNEKFDSLPTARFDTSRDTQTVKKLANFISKFSESSSKRIKRLETEIILVGMGLPIVDTRRFMQLQGATTEDLVSDGDLRVYIKTTDIDKDAETANANFLLEYLSRLLRLVEEDNLEILSGIKVQIRLGEHSISSYEGWSK